MERQSRSQDGGDDGLLSQGSYRLDSQRCIYIFGLILKSLADFVGHDFAYALKVAAEAHTVLLDGGVAQFGHELVENAVGQA